MVDLWIEFTTYFWHHLPAIAIALGSVLWVELVRDIYHTLSHLWQPLYRLHVWHHRVFRPDLSVVNDTIYRQAHWYNDLPEALVMLVFSVLPWSLAYTWDFNPQWVVGAGSIYTLTFLATAIARGFGIPYVDELTDLTHCPGEFTSLPSRWFVNRPYQMRQLPQYVYFSRIRLYPLTYLLK